jgi:phosphatidylserine decarboxylase
MKIHKEGKNLLFVLLLLLIAIDAVAYNFIVSQAALWIVIGFSIIIFLLVLQFFRNPTVVVPIDEKHIYAPADGKVVAIERVEANEFISIPSQQISIFMSPVNVHVNRAPVSGKVKLFRYHKGRYLVAWHPKSSSENEQTTMIIQMSNGVEILVRQIAGALARRIKWYVEEGDDVIQGNEFGFIKFGSRVDILIPEDFTITAQIGEKTKAGKTIIATVPD